MSELEKCTKSPWYHCPCDMQCLETTDPWKVVCLKCALVIYVGESLEESEKVK